MENSYIHGSYLVNRGFTKDNNTYSKIIQHRGAEMIINGQRMVQQSAQSKFEVEYIGEGYVDETPIHGYDIRVNGELQIRAYVYNENELADYGF